MVVYLDAIGSILKPIPNQKRVLYYPVLLKTTHGDPPIPVAEMVTTDHTAANMFC